MLDNIIVQRYLIRVIVSFKGKETGKIFHRQFSRKLPHNIQSTAMRKLWQLDAAVSVADLKVPPANHLEALQKDRIGQWSIRINEQYRICFRWEAGNAHDVEIVDYH